MSTAFVAALFAVSILTCFGAGIWLMLHLTALAAMFQGKIDIVASPRPPRVSRRAVGVALTVFFIGLGGIAANLVIAFDQAG